MNSKLLKLIDTLSLPLDNPAARRALRDFAADVGFRYFAQLNLRGSESFAVSNYPARWQRIYVARKFMRVDPVVTHAKHGPSIFTWSADEARKAGRAEVTAFFDAAERFDIRSGLSIAVPIGFKHRLVLTLATERPSTEILEPIDHVTAAMAVAFTHARIGNSGEDTSVLADVRLSPREAECLRWFAEGVGVPDIALSLGIAYGSARSYLESASKKLGATNTRQASTIAVRLGII